MLWLRSKKKIIDYALSTGGLDTVRKGNMVKTRVYFLAKLDPYYTSKWPKNGHNVQLSPPHQDDCKTRKDT